MIVNNLHVEDICDFIGGSQPEKSEFINEPKPGYVRLIQTRDYKTDAFPTYIPENSTRKFCDETDVMIGRYGPPIFQICRGLKGAYNVALLKAKPKKGIDREFLYYFLKQDTVFRYVDKLSARTGGQTGVDLVSLNNYPVRVPNKIEDQQKLVASLVVIDKKIELNNRINAELEAMAKTLYNYWFVQFDFPDANGKPYKTSGGKMVYNPTLKREIPEGWEVCELGEVIERSGTGLNPRDNFKLGEGDNFYVTIKNVSNGKIVLDDKCDRIGDEALAIIDKRSQLQPGDVLFTSIEPVGATYLIQEKPTNWNINESVFTLRPSSNKITAEYLYLLLSSDEMKIFTKNSSTGSVHKGIRHRVLKTFKLAYKNKEIVEKFSEIVNPILARSHLMDKEIQLLIALRDWLLPMLMNGQVTVK